MSDELFESANVVVKLYEEGKLGIMPTPGTNTEVFNAFDVFAKRVRHERGLQSLVEQADKDRTKDPLG